LNTEQGTPIFEYFKNHISPALRSSLSVGGLIDVHYSRTAIGGFCFSCGKTRRGEGAKGKNGEINSLLYSTTTSFHTFKNIFV